MRNTSNGYTHYSMNAGLSTSQYAASLSTYLFVAIIKFGKIKVVVA